MGLQHLQHLSRHVKTVDDTDILLHPHVLQEREVAIDDVLQKYLKRMADRTDHHMG